MCRNEKGGYVEDKWPIDKVERMTVQQGRLATVLKGE
jgi:hypothetical protein